MKKEYSVFFELLKEMYYHELEQRDKINDRVSIPLGVLFLLIGGAAYYANNISGLINNNWYSIFIVLYALYIILIVLSIYYAVRAYYGYGYVYIPKAKIINSNIDYYINYYNNNYEKYFKSKTDKTKEELIEIDVKSRLYPLYRDAIDINRELNKKKIKYLRRLGWAIVIAIIIGAVSVFPYYAIKNNDNIQKVQIVNQVLDQTIDKGGEKSGRWR